MLMEGHFLKCRGKKRHRAWAPSQQHQPRALCALSMRCWNDAPRADASRLRAVQPFQQTLSYGVKMALRVDPFQNRHQSVGCPVVLPLQVHAKVGQYGAGRPAETRNVGAGLGGPELPCCYTKSIGIICSPLCDAIQHRNELMIAHQCESIIDLLSAPLTIPLVCCHINNFRRASSGSEAMARRRKEERRAGLASRGM